MDNEALLRRIEVLEQAIAFLANSTANGTALARELKTLADSGSPETRAAALALFDALSKAELVQQAESHEGSHPAFTAGRS